MPPFVRSQQVQAALTGQLNVHTQAVGQKAQLFQQLGAGARDGFGMDVAPEVVLPPQQPQASLGLKSPEEAAEYANRVLDAAMAAENFVYNGYVVDYGGGDQ